MYYWRPKIPQENRNRTGIILGLAGGVGSGKSSVARLLEEEGAEVIDADHLAHEALKQPAIQQEIRDTFGDEFVTGGAVDRDKLGDLVFSNPEDLEKLNSIIHPYVLEKIDRRIENFEQKASGSRILVLDVPLLYETGLETRCDYVIFVRVPEKIRARRLKKERGWDISELRKRESRQDDLDLKRENSEFIIDNSRSMESTRKQINDLLSEIINPAD